MNSQRSRIVATQQHEVSDRSLSEHANAREFPGRFLDALDVRMRGELDDGLGLQVDAGSAGDVVEDQRVAALRRRRREVAAHALLRRLVVVRRDDEERGDRQAVDGTRQFQRLRRGVRAGAGDDRNASCRKLARLLEQLDVLAMIERRGFAGGARDDEHLGARARRGNRRRFAKSPVVDRAVCIHRRHHRHHAAGQHRRDPCACGAKKANDSTGACLRPAQPESVAALEAVRGTLPDWLQPRDFLPMEQLMVISAVGGDPTAVVQELTRVIMDCGGNIKESRMAAFGSEFAMLLLVSGNWHTISRMERELNRFANSNGVTMQLKRTEPRRVRQGAPALRRRRRRPRSARRRAQLERLLRGAQSRDRRGVDAQLRRDAYGRADVLRADGHQHSGERAHLRAARRIHGILRSAQRRRDHGAGQALLSRHRSEDSTMAAPAVGKKIPAFSRRHDGDGRS